MTTQRGTNLARTWQALSLRAAGVSLIDCEHRTPPAANVGYPYVAIPQIKNGHLDLTDARRITPEHFTEWTRKARPQAHDVILSRRCNPGETAVVPLGLECALGQNLVLLRADGTKVHPAFLRWLVRGPEWWEQIGTFINVGALFDSLKCADVPNFTLSIPPIGEQQRIAEILDALDAKIELNRRMSETLETMARTLFKSWFVDFDPVRGKAAIRREHPKWTNAQVSRAALPNLAPDIAEIFPDHFEDSCLGPIPAGWTLSKLADQVEASKGLSYKGSGLADAGMPMHNLNSVYEGGTYKFEGIKFYAGEYRERHIVNAGDVIVANTEQGHDCLLLGYAAIVPELFGRQGLYSHHIYRLQIRAGSPLMPDFLCRLLNSRHMHELVSGFGNGTTVNMLPLDGVQKPEFILAPGPIIQAFSTLAAGMRRRHEAFISQNRDLARTRDSLLPRLLSGDPSVPECDP
jgi:type I restriction enzyme S subunit